MHFSSSRAFAAIKAAVSGGSITLTVYYGFGIMCCLMSWYNRIIPGGPSKAPALTQLFRTFPYRDGPFRLVMGCLFAGTTWMAGQEKEKSMVIIHRLALAFTIVVIFAAIQPLYNSGQNPLMEELPVPLANPFTEYLWLLPLSIPLLIAMSRHRRARRCRGLMQPSDDEPRKC